MAVAKSDVPSKAKGAAKVSAKVSTKVSEKSSADVSGEPLETQLFKRLVGHEATLKPLLQAAFENRLAGTLLFAGPSGIGKKFAALTLTQALVCETPLDDAQENRPALRPFGAGCGTCGPCLRIERGQSESLMVVEPETAQIKIEQARDVLQFLNLQKLGRARVIIIDEAHLLGPQAGNALLKALEEPPPGTHFILVSHLPNSILATLRSRSQLVRFKPLSEDALTALIKQEIPNTKVDDWLLRSAGGSLEAARRRLEDRAEFEELEHATTSYLEAALNGFPMAEIAVLRESLKDRTAHGFISSCLQMTVTDALKIKAGLSHQKAKSKSDPRVAIATRLAEKSSRQLDLLARKSLEFEADLARNVDRGLLLEALAIELSR